jgi:uncharacterized protein
MERGLPARILNLTNAGRLPAFRRIMKLLIFILLFGISNTFAQSQTKTVRQFIEAFNSRNLDAMMNLATDDVKWFTVAGDKLTTETTDKSSLRKFMEGYFKSCPTCKSKVTNISQNGSRVTMTETASWETAKGKQSSDSFAVYEFVGGKIARVYYYGEPSKSSYDAALAKKLGADERGMKTYVFVNLIRGKKTYEKAERDKYIAGHMENIGKLAESGTLVLAGPFFDDNDIRGIYIFDVDTLEKAKALVETDPAVKAGVFEFEMRLWYGSAALLELNRIHNSIKKPTVTK